MATRPADRPKRVTVRGRSRSRTFASSTQGEPARGLAITPATSQDGAMSQEKGLANGLGVFGIGLGLAELLVPRRLARTLGVPSEHHRLIRAMGAREIASSVSILMQRTPTAGVWSRVVGDLIDLACLGAVSTSKRSDRRRLAVTTAAVAGATVLDLVCAQQLSRGVRTRNGKMPITVSLVIDRSPEDLYKHWRKFSNFPSFMKHVKSVEIIGECRSHWVVAGPLGTIVQWDAEITEDQPNERLAWRSVEGSDVDHSGRVRFEQAPGGRGTMMTVEMQYGPPGGTLGSAVSAWFGEDPNQSIKMDLRRFKQVMETGEVITTDGQSAGRSASTSMKYDPAVRR